VLDLRATTPKKRAAPSAAAKWNERPQTATPAPTMHPAAAQVTPRPGPAAAPHAAAKEVHFNRFEDRFKRAKGVPRSQHISKFVSQFSPVAPKAEEGKPAAELPAAVATQHQAMARLAQPLPAASPRGSLAPASLRLGSRLGQYGAVAAVVAVMGGYIWLQNAPKLSIQSASGRAGVTASLPGYVPSSYHLAATATTPGLVTLRFTSPSAADALTVQQHRTTWDSKSLLDQFVASKSPEYTAVEGQGLTIYLYGQNQATWVNHGVWYSIEGATRLSREQILKVAYSL
jgi:hypothetical protein